MEAKKATNKSSRLVGGGGGQLRAGAKKVPCIEASEILHCSVGLISSVSMESLKWI